MDAFFALYPLGSILFFRKVFLYSMVTGVTMMVPVSLFVYDQWESRQLCDRVLRGYHTTRSLMFICQLPLRCRMLRQLAAARELPNRAAVVNTLITMLHSRSWKFNQITGIISYLLFGFGLVFAYTGSHCSASSPMLYRMLIISLVVFIAQTICSCLWLRQITVEDAFDASMWKRGLQADQIDRVTKLLVVPSAVEMGESNDWTSTDDCSASPAKLVIDGCRIDSRECSICFNEYAPTERLRMLQCAHCFHQVCVDAWLLKKKSCPLCLCEIDQPIATTKFMADHHSKAIQPQAPIRVGAALVEEETEAAAASSDVSSPTASSSSSAAASLSSSHAPASASAASSAPAVVSAEDARASTAALFSGLRARRANGSTAPTVYSTASGFETSHLDEPDANAANARERSQPNSTAAQASSIGAVTTATASNAAPRGSESSSEGTQESTEDGATLTHRGIKVVRRPNKAAVAQALSAEEEAVFASLSALTAPSSSSLSSMPLATVSPIVSAGSSSVAAAAAAAAAPSSSVPVPAGSTPAVELDPARQVYAAARRSALESWRAELDDWAEQPEDESTDAEAAARAGANTDAEAQLDAIMRQWRAEEEELQHEETDEEKQGK